VVSLVTVALRSEIKVFWCSIFWKKLLHQKNFNAPQCAVTKRKSGSATIIKIDFMPKKAE
jgi:hypothetical protein